MSWCRYVNLNQRNTVLKQKINKRRTRQRQTQRRTRQRQTEKTKKKTKNQIYVDNHLFKYKKEIKTVLKGDFKQKITKNHPL
jgi:hypothetical protein